MQTMGIFRSHRSSDDTSDDGFNGLLLDCGSSHGHVKMFIIIVQIIHTTQGLAHSDMLPRFKCVITLMVTIYQMFLTHSSSSLSLLHFMGFFLERKGGECLNFRLLGVDEDSHSPGLEPQFIRAAVQFPTALVYIIIIRWPIVWAPIHGIHPTL